MLFGESCLEFEFLLFTEQVLIFDPGIVALCDILFQQFDTALVPEPLCTTYSFGLEQKLRFEPLPLHSLLLRGAIGFSPSNCWYA